MNLRAFFIKKASDFAPMPCYSIRLLCVLLHLHCEPRSEAKGVSDPAEDRKPKTLREDKLVVFLGKKRNES